jgi:uroporphyrinogen-III decarboxylase
MTVGKLREKYPGVILLGNVSSVTLCSGTEQQVREEVRATLSEAGGYDYIAGPSNAIVHGTPVENVYAMVEEITG